MKKEKNKTSRGPLDCVQAERWIRPYLTGELSTYDRERFIEHMQYCPACREELEINLAIYNTLREDEDILDRGSYDFQKQAEEHLNRSRSEIRSGRLKKRAERLIVTLSVLTIMLAGLGSYVYAHYYENERFQWIGERLLPTFLRPEPPQEWQEIDDSEADGELEAASESDDTRESEITVSFADEKAEEEKTENVSESTWEEKTESVRERISETETL